MQTITLPGSGRHTSQLGFGCSRLLTDRGRRGSLALLEAAFDAGIRHFDVAPLYGYGEAENCLGEFAARHRDQITIATKVGLEAPRTPGLLRTLRRTSTPVLQLMPQLRRRFSQSAAPSAAPARLPFCVPRIRESLERSLRALKTGYIDLFLLHEADASDEFDRELRAFLEEAKKAGKIGAFGCASERSKLASLQAALPWLCDVLEYNWSPKELLPVLPAFRVQHRVLAEHLPQARTLLLGANEECPFAPAQILLRAALLAYPSGILLFSSTSKAHIDNCVHAATHAALEVPAARLLATMQDAPSPMPHAHLPKYSQQSVRRLLP